MIRRMVVFLFILVSTSAFAEAPYRTERPTLLLKSGRKITAEIRIPEIPASERFKRMPVVILFGGFENAARVLDLFQTNERVIRASFDYPFDGPRRFSWLGQFANVPEFKRTIHQTSEGIRKLVDELSVMPEVDQTRITIIGASVGAPFAVQGASTDSRIRGLVVIHGFADIRRTIVHQFKTIWKPVAEIIGTALWWYADVKDTYHYAERLIEGQKVLAISARQDSFIPRGCTLDLHYALKQSEAFVEIRWQEGDHLQPGAMAQIAELVKISTEWLRSQRLI